LTTFTGRRRHRAWHRRRGLLTDSNSPGLICRTSTAPPREGQSDFHTASLT